MKEILIKELSFLNFKGLRDVTVTFDGKQTTVSGENGAGKSTIFDGFTWLLFGKNHKDKEQFGIKTYDSNNNVIPKIPHEVAATLLVDGEEIKLRRCYIEKWVKKRGSAIEEFKGHEQERFYNEVPCNEAEWNAKIASICDERIFKFVTSPTFFISQPKGTQRELLFSMAGNVSDAEIASGNAEFTQLLADTVNKTMDEYKREVRAKISLIKDSVKGIPSAIEERRRDIFAEEDWEALEAELNEKNAALANIEQQMLDASKAQQLADEQRTEILKQINATNEAISQRSYAIVDSVLAEHRKQIAERTALIDKANDLRRKIARQQQEKIEAQAAYDIANQQRDKLVADYYAFNKMTIAIESEQMQVAEESFVCPTCKRQYDIEDVERIQSQLQQNFIAGKKKRLSEVAKMITENETKGKEIRAKRDAAEERMAQLDIQIEVLRKQIDEIEAQPLFITEPIAPDSTPIIAVDTKLKELKAKKDELSALYSKDALSVDVSGLQEGRIILTAAIDELKQRLLQKELNERNLTRIAELENQYRIQSDEIAQLEGIEYTIQEFSKAKTRALEDKVNSLFKSVKFKLFETQVNGAEIETCEALVNGVPISDVNDAGIINAGIDIINTISKHMGVCAPIFCDNAEGVNNLADTDSQVIRLVVTTTPGLTVTNS